MLEFAVTTIGLVGELNDLLEPYIVLGLILIESCDETTLNTYRRIPGVSAKVDHRDWSASKPQKCLLALI